VTRPALAAVPDADRAPEPASGPAAPIPARPRKPTSERVQRLNALALRFQLGDRRAGDAFLRELTPWVRIRAHGYAGPLRADRAALEDLHQEGLMGAMHGARKWHAGKGANVFTYATLWIDAYVRNYILTKVPAMKLSAAERNAASSRAVRGSDGEEVNPVRRAAVARLAPLMSIDRPLRLDDGDTTLADILAAPGTDVDEQLVDLEAEANARAEIEFALSTLPARWQDVVRRRLLVDEPETFDSIGRSMDLSRERIRQIERLALARIARILDVRREAA
jgi:RNA polymerase sigma factor (sigma-70 family)